MNNDIKKLIAINYALIAYYEDDQYKILSSFISKKDLIADIKTEISEILSEQEPFHPILLSSAEFQLKQILDGKKQIALS
jgi:hypothetical protein